MLFFTPRDSDQTNTQLPVYTNRKTASREEYLYSWHVDLSKWALNEDKLLARTSCMIQRRKTYGLVALEMIFIMYEYILIHENNDR